MVLGSKGDMTEVTWHQRKNLPLEKTHSLQVHGKKWYSIMSVA